ncbi:ArsR/SmtB family transcription factor [Flindersiella endophytica]
MSDDSVPVILEDPGQLKALSHPMRRQILHQLRVHGPATSTTIGEVLGSNTGTTSYHLRQLEKHAFIEEVPERAGGRERWWRIARTPRDLRLPTPEALSPEDRPALTELMTVWYTEDQALLGRLPAAYERDREWTRVSRGFTHMTEADLAEFFEAYLELLRRHGHRAEDAPPGARPVYVRLFALPADED